MSKWLNLAWCLRLADVKYFLSIFQGFTVLEKSASCANDRD